MMLKISSILFILADAMLLAGIINFFWSKYRAGLLLLTLEEQPSHRLRLVIGILNIVFFFLILGLERSIELGSSALLLIGCYFILIEKSRPEIRQKGLWNLGLIKWNELENYTWQTEAEVNRLITSRLPLFVFRPSDLSVMIRKPSTIPRSNRLLLNLKHRKRQRQGWYSTFLIAPSQKKTIDNLLRQYLSPVTELESF